MSDVDERYESLEKYVVEHIYGADAERLRKAYEYAKEAHKSQLRKDGSPYVTHPLAAAEIVAEMGLDMDSIIAAILHDCIEDTDATHEDIAKKFGEPVAEIVEGVTKLSRVVYNSKEEEQVENLRKMLMAMAKDIRVILIKIADRLHNMRTMQFQSESKQRTKALETMEIYAPIAHRLGMQKIKWELEDISLRYLDPYGYAEITAELQRRSADYEEFLDLNQKRIEERLSEAGIKATVYGRVKHIYSIYRKMYSQDKSLSEVYDFYAFRVIVDTITECYNVLGQLHDLFKPVPGRFKDYIGTPKPNLYQSLHTTVIGREGVPFEVQIRTWEMHRTAEYGIAAHWKYKQGLGGYLGSEEKLEWIRRLLENQQEMDPEDFISTLKVDMFADEVFVFTPNGDVINLPAGATPIDFAYAIHSAIGNRMTGVKVNGRIATYDYCLQNGDVVEVSTSNAGKGPSRDWMKLAKSNEARTKIRQWFKKEKREENIVQGKQSFESEMKRSKLPVASIMGDEVLSIILRRLSFNTLDDMYAAIGYGGISAQKAVNKIRDELLRINRVESDKNAIDKLLQEPRRPRHTDSGVYVEGIENCMTKFSRCCMPVPGDPVVGYITRGFGVSVHREDCINVIRDLGNTEDRERWVKVGWAEESEKGSYETSLELSVKDRDNMVADLVTAINALKVKVVALNARRLNDGYGLVSLSVAVTDLNQLNAVINRLNRLGGVIEVKRMNG